MSRTIGAAALTVVISALLAVQIASMTVDGGVAPTLLSTGACGVSIASTAAADPQGLRPGDRIDLPALDTAARVYLETGSARAGALLPIAVSRDGFAETVRSPGTQPSLWFWLPGALVKLIIFAVGVFVLWRGKELAAWLFGAASLAISVVIDPAPSSLLSPSAQAIFFAASIPLAELAALCFYFMIERMSKPFVRPPLVVAARTVALAGLALALSDNLTSPIARIKTGCVNPFLAGAHAPGYLAALLATLVILTLAFAKASGDARRRMRWIVVSTAVGFSGVIVTLGAHLAGKPIPDYPIVDLTAVAIPIGYAYAIMRHRVIDVGFAINRAVVFAVMSSVVVAAFALLSGALERAAIGQSASVALQVIVALGLALSFNALEKRVESAIDRVFFRRKHEAQAALAQFGDDAPFVHDVDVLLARVVELVRSQLGAADVAVYVSRHDDDYDLAAAAGDRFPAAVPIDDPLFVRLRASLRDVDSDDVRSAIAQAFTAFPLAAHGRLIGGLICGHRADGEAYDPDERAALRALSSRLASVIEGLRAREYARLVKAIAEGSVTLERAMQRAKDLLAAD